MGCKSALVGACFWAMKLNADVGEGVGDDEALFRWIDLANVACGGHAGGVEEMKVAVDLAVTYGVAVGAHPGYPDRENFGRVSVSMEAWEIVEMVVEQVGVLDEVCRQIAGGGVEYVKPHGALYHDMMQRPEVMGEMFASVCELSNRIPLMVMARVDDDLEKALSEELGVPLLFEAFADRAYGDDGMLVARGVEGAVYAEADKMVAQAVELASEGVVTTVGGGKLELKADTVCVHGDNVASIAAARAIYESIRL